MGGFSKLDEKTEAAKPAKAAGKKSETGEVASQALAVLEGAGLPAVAEGGGGALAAMTAKESQLIYPVVQIAGGEAGGAYAPITSISDETAKLLPQGRGTFPAMFIGWRLEVQAWPVGYNQRSEEGNAPSWSCAISQDNADDTDLARRAAEAIQYTKSTDREKFNFEESGAGHICVTFQVLLYATELDDFFVLQTPQNLDAVKESMEFMAKHVDPKTGILAQFPAHVGVDSRPIKYPNGFKNKVHRIQMSKALDSEGEEVLKACKGFFADLKTDEDGVVELQQWLTGADKQISDAERNAMHKAIALNDRE